MKIRKSMKSEDDDDRREKECREIWALKDQLTANLKSRERSFLWYDNGGSGDFDFPLTHWVCTSEVALTQRLLMECYLEELENAHHARAV